MYKRISLLLLAALSWGSALALDDLVIDVNVDFETCDEFIVPVLIHTMPGSDELDAFARLIQHEQRIWMTKSHYLMFEPEPLGILIDLLQGYRGGFVRVQIFDSDGSPTWETTVGVNPLEYRTDIMRRVVPVQVPAAEIRGALPRSGVYRISAQAFPLDEDGAVCGGEAATSIIVNLAYP